MRTKMYASLGLAALSGAAAFLLPYPAVLVAFGLFGLSSAVAVATGLAALAASRSRLDHAEARRFGFWKGRVGRWLFTLASPLEDGVDAVRRLVEQDPRFEAIRLRRSAGRRPHQR